MLKSTKSDGITGTVIIASDTASIGTLFPTRSAMETIEIERLDGFVNEPFDITLIDCNSVAGLARCSA